MHFGSKVDDFALPYIKSFSIVFFYFNVFFKFHLEMGAKQLQTSVLDVLNYVSACNVFVMNIVFFFKFLVCLYFKAVFKAKESMVFLLKMCIFPIIAQ